MDSDKDYTYSINPDDLEDTLTVSSISAPIQRPWIGPLQDPSNTDTITLPGLGPQFSYSSASTITSGPYSAVGGIQYPNVTVTSPTGFASPWLSTNANGAGKIRLEGDGADVEVNGWSLVDAVKRIEQRLGLFQPNPELEAEWAELRELSEQYKKLEQHIRDKQDTWDRIKAMPAPNID